MDDVTRQGENGPHLAVVGTGPESIYYYISRNRNGSCQQGAERPHVAVVGAGASGLAAARQLLNAGARVTIFEVCSTRDSSLIWKFLSPSISVLEKKSKRATGILSRHSWNSFESLV